MVKKRLQKSKNWTKKAESDPKYRNRRQRSVNDDRRNSASSSGSLDKYSRKKRTREWAAKSPVDLRPLKRSKPARKSASSVRKARRTREWKRKDPRTPEGRAEIDRKRKAKINDRKKNNYDVTKSF